MRKQQDVWTSEYVAKHRRRRFWQRIVSVLGCVVVFCTTYALILPAITEEKASFCGFEEHTHSDECYAVVTEPPAETAAPETTPEETVPPETVAPTEAPQLICQLEEVTAHQHTESCFAPAHSHGEGCYGEAALICGLEEGSVHVHGDNCYGEEVLTLTCTITAEEAHTHTDGCFTTEPGGLVCTLEETEGHAHSESCYGEDGGLVCALEETEGHSHGENCYGEDVRTQICGREETAGHAHGDGCYTSEGKPLTCGLSDTETHAHTDACYGDPSLICGLEERAEAEQICTLEETEGHAHTEECYEQVAGATESAPEVTEAPAETVPEVTEEEAEPERELICGLEEHTHELICFSDKTADVETSAEWEKTLPGNLTGVWREDVVSIAVSQLGYEESTRNYVVENGDIYGYSRYGAWYGDEYGDWCAMFVAFCLDYSGVEDIPYDSACQDWIEELTEAGLYVLEEGYIPQPGDLIFFDYGANGTANHVGLVESVTEATESSEAKVNTIEGNSGDRVQRVSYNLSDGRIMGYAQLPYQPTAEEQTQIDSVIAQIDAMPSADEIDAKIAEYEEAEDYEGLEVWYTEVCQQVATVYQQYSALSDEQKAQVTNAEKLLELEYIWSVTIQEVPAGSYTVYQINSYVDSSSDDSVMVFGGTVAEKVTYAFKWWYAIKVEEDNNGDLRVVEILQPGDDSVKSNYRADDTGFVLLIYYTNTVDVVVGDYVTVNFTVPNTGVYKSAGYGTISFRTVSPDLSSDPLKTVQSANTSEFVKLNLYDYHGTKYSTGYTNINQRYSSNSKEYPGFQWNGGAYPYRYRADGYSKYGWIANRNLVDCIDFGNSLITDYELTASPYVPDQSSKVSSTSVWYKGNITAGKIGIASSTGANGLINAIVYGDDVGNTDRPAGLTSSFGNAVTLIANDNGYPDLTKTASSTYGQSLEYLFSGAHPGMYADQRNSKNIDGLFQYDPVSGAYFYDSRENHAQFDDVNDKFVLYEQVITPNFILYPFGNFMPLNDITDRTTQVSAMNYEGGVATYFQTIINRLLSDSSLDNSEIQLIRMLYSYRYSWENWSDSNASHGRKWFDITSADALNDYFNNSSEFASEAWDFNSTTQKTASGRTLSQLMDKVYNIAFDVESNFFFGMDMEMNFYQPKDGMTGTDSDGDGDFDYPMEFYFAGDDDVWVYIDNVLFLDLTGIHRHVGGKIDFVYGKVYYYSMDSYVDGAVTTSAYTDPMTFEQILENAGVDPSEYLKKDANGNYTTFKDYSIHKFHFYYTERGSGSSVCRLNFNFPLLRQNTLSVEKALTDDSDSIEALGNPDFMFQVMDADTDALFLPEGWAYSLYDVDGSLLQEIVVNEKYADGRVKSMDIKDANGKIICTETYESNGDLKARTGTDLDKVLRIGENGIFTLKAGQRAEFVGIPESWGKYYVRELLDGLDLSQYEEITVSGVAADKQTVQIGGTTFTGLKSPILDMTNGSSTFRFNNKITTVKLAKLSITKKLNTYVAPLAETYYRMYVTLDGEPLPVGTEYIVAGETRTVAEAGYIQIAAGETATIENILSGTRFEITEDPDSAAGYTVQYEQTGAEDVTNDGTCISGVVRTEAAVAVTVTNSEKGTYVTIPGTKSVTHSDGTNRTFRFNLTEVTDYTGATPVTGGTTMTAEAAAGDTAGTFGFLITYYMPQFDELPTNFYYRITEASHENTLTNTTTYVAQVTVSSDGEEGITAEVTGMWKDGAEISDSADYSADFVNTLTGDLTVEKLVDGGSDAQSLGFTFTITLDVGQSGLKELPASYPAVFHQQDGAEVSTTVTLNENGQIVLNEFKHGEKAVISGIPLGAYWKVEETGADGFVVDTTITADGDPVTGTGTVTEGNVVAGNTSVTYTNRQTYELPETGGAGTTPYTMAGLGLMLTALCLMYMMKKRRKGVQ